MLPLVETQKAIKLIKEYFQLELSNQLNLLRVSAPLFVDSESGINDDLCGDEPVFFPYNNSKKAVIVHSLAKWKRMALAKYKMKEGCGIYTDMIAIRKEEVLSPINSYYVDQWDWELVIKKNERTEKKLEAVVSKIYMAIKKLEHNICKVFPEIPEKLPETITFITTQELEDQYPNLNQKEKEYACSKKHGAVFIKNIGNILKSGKKHDERAPDYDDWDLNGDIFVYYPTLDIALELSSMGVRVDSQKLLKQLKLSGTMDRINLPFHKSLLNEELPHTIGGGIGQSRLCMFLLNKLHIGEVQVSLWDENTYKYCEKNKINLL